MKKFILKSFLATFLCASLAGCGSDSMPEPTPTGPTDSTQYAATNEWIYTQMKYYYLWTDDMPDKDDTNLDTDPEKYYAALLSAEDRFSWITNNSTKSLSFADDTYANDYGFHFAYIPAQAQGREIWIIVVLQVVPGSPADQAGIRRGTMFIQFDDTYFDASNWYAALYETSSVTLRECVLEGNTLTAASTTYSLTRTSYYNTPIIHHSVLDVDGSPVGYLVYDSYASGANNTFVTDLKNVFREFKRQNVEDLILDLRYNPGGELNVVLELAAMIAPEENVRGKDVFAYLSYNDSYSAGRPEDEKVRKFSMTESDITRYHLGLDRLFVIAFSGSASASEVTIHCLRRFMDVQHYGEVTTGKNVGSIGITSSSFGYTLQPIVSRIYDNRYLDDPSYAAGLTPQREITEYVPLGDFGVTDPDENYDDVLVTAIGYMTGTKSVGASEADDHRMRLNYPVVRDKGILIE